MYAAKGLCMIQRATKRSIEVQLTSSDAGESKCTLETNTKRAHLPELPSAFEESKARSKLDDAGGPIAKSLLIPFNR